MKRIFVGAGHSNIAPGYVTREFREFDLNKEAVEIISFRLKEVGVEVVFPEEDIYSLPYPQYLSHRIQQINELHKTNPFDLVLDIHHNSATSPRANGTWFIYGSQKGKYFADRATEFMKKIKHKVRSVSVQELQRKLGFIQKTLPPAVIVECAFMDGATDKLILRFNRGLLYNAIADALLYSLNNKEQTDGKSDLPAKAKADIR